MSILLYLAAAVVPAGSSFICTPVRVWDGDGPVWCAEGPHVRLSGVAAREMDGTCRVNQPCPKASALKARDTLVSLLGGPKGSVPTGHIIVSGPKMRCLSQGSAGGTRTAAWCNFPSGRDLSCAMVATGTVLRWARYWKDHKCPNTQYR